ncbi:MAG TPA: hypothetical protein VHC49_07840 [Mycobacteriales bacterium]|nr:hypothetical protein [Mycobacteriales bacterium]
MNIDHAITSLRRPSMIRENPIFLLLVATVRQRLEPLREKHERGASAIEWAIIAAVSVGVAVFVGTLIWNKVRSQSDCINSGGDGCNGK